MIEKGLFISYFEIIGKMIMHLLHDVWNFHNKLSIVLVLAFFQKITWQSFYLFL